MVYRTYERSYDASIWNGCGESLTGTITLPRDRRISELMFHMHLNVLNGTTSQTMTARQVASILNNITLKVNGQTGNISVEGGRYFDFVKYLTGREPLVMLDNVAQAEGATLSMTNSGTTVVDMFLPFYFRRNVKNPYDVSALLDAFSLSSLEVDFSMRSGWLPADTDLTITESGSTVRAYLKEVYADKATLDSFNKMNGYSDYANVFYHQQQDKTITTSAGYANSIDLQTAYVHQQMMLHAYDASVGTWANDIIDKFKIKQIGEQGDIEFADLRALQFCGEDVNAHSLHIPAAGAYMWDADSKLGGLDTLRMKNGDLKLYYDTGSTVSSGNDLLDVMYKSYIPVSE